MSITFDKKKTAELEKIHFKKIFLYKIHAMCNNKNISLLECPE